MKLSVSAHRRLSSGLLAATAVASLATLTPHAAHAQYTTTVNPATNWGSWQGWGCSLCWWANVFGTRTDLSDIIFSQNTTVFNGQSLPGLGLNIVRYNAGGCTTVAANGSSMVASPNIPAWKQIQGYWLNWNSTNPASTSWNWNVDSNQRNALWNARARGVNHFELFSNSPMWWMCYNSNPSGASSGSSDNLQSWNYDSHAVYLATVAKYAHDNWGFDFDTVDAFNEPISNWWTATGNQEGCHFQTSTQASVIGDLRTELNNRSLTSAVVAASDENTYDLATSTYNSFKFKH